MADILSTMNRVAKTLDLVPMLKLDILKVGRRAFLFASFFFGRVISDDVLCVCVQEIASTMGRSSDGLTTVLQLQGLCSQIFLRGASK